MKLRTSFFDKTVFRKDITRFAPAWILYTICLLVGMMLMRQGSSARVFHEGFEVLLEPMSVINLCYALLASLLLFGDLYNSRMCNAIHALPVTREGLFISHTAAGMAWSIVPTVLATLLALVLGVGSDVEGGWMMPLWWLLGTNLQYLFFFGVAAFSALCVGSRFAQAVIYGILNFGSLIAYWLVDILYTPLLYGLQTREDGFLLASPVVTMAGNRYMDIVRDYNEVAADVKRYYFQLGEGWGYLAICAAIGIALLVCACLLYRKRDLESAGDFMAVKALEPVFLAVYSLVIGTVFYFFVEEILYLGTVSFVYMAIGLAVGFFTGEMLLKRTIRIFRKKVFVKFAALAVGFALTLVVTWLDPLGLVHWIPDADDVVSVEISPSYYSYYDSVTLDEPGEIRDVLRVHELALEDMAWDPYNYGYTAEYSVSADGDYYYRQYISIYYTLTDGSVKSRHYAIWTGSEAAELLVPHFSSLEALFQDYEGVYTPAAIADAVYLVRINDGYGAETAISDPEEIESLLEAIEADCEAGLMARNYYFRSYPEVATHSWIAFDMENNVYTGIDIYTNCVNVNAWLREHDYLTETMEKLIAEYPG